ncbi:MAG TPA: polysaccharide deacetylase family protein [Solirubrobacteraceae bacterium]
MGVCALLGVVVAIAIVVESAGAAASGPQPFAITKASLTQDGTQLVWHVNLGHPFAPAKLKSGRRSLCLLIERAKGGSVSGVLCVDPSKDGKSPQLDYQHVSAKGRGPARKIGATFSRTSAKDLTVRFGPAGFKLPWAPMRWQTLSTLTSKACGPNGCNVRFPAQPSLAKLHSPVPVGCVASGSSFVTNGSRSKHEVAFTFDDGPWPDTPQFLDILEREHVPATFFQIGEQVGTYGPAVDKRMLADGDIIGDHTWNHADVAGDGAFGASEISRAASAIQGLTGFKPCLFRAPGGAVSSALISEARNMGLLTIQWDVDPRDWARPGTDAIYSNVVDHAQNGSIIIQHDGGGDRSETLAALPREIATLRSRGYTFVTIPQLLGLKLIYK